MYKTNLEDYATVRQLAKRYGLSQPTIYANLYNHPEIRTVKMGYMLLVNKEDYDLFNKERGRK